MEKSRPDATVGRGTTDQAMSRQFDWSETPPSVAAVRLLSVAMNCDPVAIEPLAESVDPDMLDRLLPSMAEGSELQFTHLGLSVSLYGDGTAAVESEGR